MDKQELGHKWAAVAAQARTAEQELADADKALEQALAVEGAGGKSAVPARKERDDKQHALEAAQAAEASLKAQYHEAELAEAQAASEALKARYAECVKAFETHPLLAAVDAMLAQIVAFEELQAEAKQIAWQHKDICRLTGEVPMGHNRRAVSVGGEKARLLAMLENNGRGELGPQIELH